MDAKFGWLETDGCLTSMSPLHEGAVQFYSLYGPECTAGINLIGPLASDNEHPIRLVADDFDGNSPVELIWNSGRVIPLGHLNSQYLKELIKQGYAIVNWRPCGNETTKTFIAEISVRHR